LKKDGKIKLMQVAACLLCAAVVWRHENILAPLGGTEFGGGLVTGPLLTLYDVGALLFVLALLLAVFFRRIAAAITFTAALLCLPLYLYFTAPILFRWIFRSADWESPLRHGFVWNKWAVTGIVALMIAAYVSLRGLLIPADSKSRNSA
jgi:hypothetical protein